MSAPATEAVYNWYPARYLQTRTEALPAAYALIILNQKLRNLKTIEHLWKHAYFRVAADGGANRLFDVVGETQATFKDLDAVIGDLDSLREESRKYFETPSDSGQSTTVIHDPDQYSTDFDKAVKFIWENHPNVDIIALGGIGGRVDQGLSQLHHLYKYQARDSERKGGSLFLVSSDSFTLLTPAGRHRIHVREPGVNEEVFAKHVGVLPLLGPSIITTRGLEWDIKDWKTEFGGQLSTSNHVLPGTQVVELETDRDVIFTIALKETS